jgi:hypothetical protein
MLHAASTHAPAKNPEFLRSEVELELLAARTAKAERLKAVGEPIALPGKALQLEVRGARAWVAENTAVVRVLDLESGKTVALYKGHTAPCTSIAFYETPERKVLLSGSWDKVSVPLAQWMRADVCVSVNQAVGHDRQPRPPATHARSALTRGADPRADRDDAERARGLRQGPPRAPGPAPARLRRL